MLEIRSLTLEEFIQEGDQEEERNSSSRPIPALLRPDETLREYEHSFKRWLNKRHLTLHEPSLERQFRLDFAVLRAWELQRSTGSEKYQSRRTRSREELLATCILSIDEFLKSMEYFGPNGDMYLATKKLKRIAIVLKPQESPAEFEIHFKRWLRYKHVTLSMLRNDPEEERRFRQCFAYARIRYLTRGDEGPSYKSTSRRSRSPLRRRSWSRSRSRKRSVSSETDHRSQKRHRFDFNEETRRSSSSFPDASKRSQKCGHDCKSSGLDCPDLPQCIRNWADQKNRSMQKLEDEMKDRLQEIERQVSVLRDPVGDDAGENELSTVSSEQPEMPGHTDSLEPGEIPSSSTERDQCVPVNESPSTVDDSKIVYGPMSDANPQQLEKEECSHEPEEQFFAVRPDADEIMIKTEKDAELPHNAAIFHSAKTLVESVRVNDNPKKKRLVEDYTHINDQISTNETAIQDTLAYVNLTADIDKAGTTEHLNQIKELTVSINKEKRRRDSVLAAMIAHDWVGKREELDDLLQSDIQIQTPSTSHEQLMAMYDKLKQKGDQVAVLQSKLQNQLSWVSAEDTSRDDTFQELEKLADQLKDELDVLSVLENQRQSVCVGFLRSNKGVHKMLVELL